LLDEDIEVRSQELKMAASLIDTMTEDFDPDQYHDDYREALEAVIQAKIEGNDIVRPAGVIAPPTTQPADLTEILRASVAALKSERDKSGAPDASDGSTEPAGEAASGGRARSRTRTKTGAAAKNADDAKEGTAAKSRTRRKASA
jgi:DNA end-binding protein Ku